MYLKFYGLTREPFQITPDPYFFYLGPTHREAYAALVYAIRNKKGFVAITGEVGLGKTTVIRTFLNHHKEQHNLQILLIFNTKLSFKNLLKLILLELGIEKEKVYSLGKIVKNDEDFEVEAIQLMYQDLIEKYKRGINVVLILDEAQNLPVMTLEKLRLISNLETDKNKLIQIFLIGQPELDKKLSLKSLRQLKQRIELRIKLKNFNKNEVKRYIEFRLKKAGVSENNIFTKSAIKKIYKYSKGIPRKINIICDNALINGFGQNKKKIDAKIIKEVSRELYPPNSTLSFKKLSYGATFFVFFLISFYFGSHINDIDLSFSNKKGQLTYSKNSSIAYYNIKKKIEKKSNETNRVLKNNIHKEIDKTKELSFTNVVNNSATSKNRSEELISLNNTKNNTISKKIYSQNNNTLTQKKETNLSYGDIYLKNELIKKLDTSGKIIYLVLSEKLSFFNKLSPVRQIVLVEMAKQTSIPGLLSFKKMLDALSRGDYDLAAKHMIYSNWYNRVGEKAYKLAQIMKNNDKTLLLKWMDIYREENPNELF